MVDFNNEGTVTTAPQDVIKITVVERRYNVIQALELYYKQDEEGQVAKISSFKSRLYGLFKEIEFPLKKNYNDERKKPENNKYLIIKKKILSSNFKELEEAFDFINEFIYDVGLTKFDNKIKYDTTNVEDENKAKNL